jgi:protein-disulfide isomerase
VRGFNDDQGIFMNRQERRKQRTTRNSNRGGSDSKRWYWFIGGSTAIIAVVVLITLIAAGVFDSGSVSTGGLTKGQTDELKSQGHLIGDASAKVTIIEFADFQCPYCQQFWASSLQSIKSEFVETGQAAIYFHHMAFIGPESTLAAAGAECAADQGKFEPFHDVLFDKQGPENKGYITIARLETFAAEAGLDLVSFANCVRDDAHQKKVQADTNYASSIGVRSTPTLMINGMIISNPMDMSEIRAAVQTALSQ